MEANSNSDPPLHTSDPNDYENNIITEAAEILKQELDGIKSKLCNSELEVSWKAALDILPPKLTKFFCKLTGRHHEVLIASLLQDLIYATCDLRTPKHVALAVEVRHVTGSKELVVTLSKLGHCISYSDLLRIETTSANTMIQAARLLGTYIPPSLAEGKFVYGAADNIDFSECTPDGKSTTHGTNMILCQPSSSCVSSTGNLTNRIVPFVVPPTVAYETLTLEHGGDIYSMIDTTICESYDERVEPKLSHAPASHSDFYLLAEISSESQLWVKARQQNTDTPTWSAYNASKCVIPDVLTNISYLPMMDAVSTDPKTVFRCMMVMQKISAHMNQKFSVLFVDQAIYQVAQKVKWSCMGEFGDTIVMMGGFHVGMNYLSAIGTMYAELGWIDVVVDCGLFSQSAARQLTDAKPYIRCVEAHRSFYEAISLLLNESSDQQSPCMSFPRSASEQSSTSQYWLMYLDLIDIFLSLQFAERSGNWKLYLEVLEAMMPVFFAANRYRYSKWLAVHIHEMKELVGTAPEVYNEFMAGNFVVRRTKRPFSSVSTDMALEQTLNRDVKTTGGLIGKSNRGNARSRWYLTAHMKAQVSSEMSLMTGQAQHDEHPSTHHSDNKADRERSVSWTSSILKSFKSRE